MNDKNTTDSSRQTDAYRTMLQRLWHGLEDIEDDVAVRLQFALEAAREKAFELGELTREEADQVAEYLKRDIESAAEYLAAEGRELSDWLKFDTELVEDRIIDMISGAINPASLQWQSLARQAEAENIWYMGEVTGPGTFECLNCAQSVSLYHIQDIPACTNCGAGQFRRISQ